MGSDKVAFFVVNRVFNFFLKFKVACGAFSALQPVGRLYPCPQWVPLIHLQRRHAPLRHERPLLAKEGTIQGILLAHSIIHGGTGFFYMPKNWDMGQILSIPFWRKACGGFFRCPKKSNDFGQVWTCELGYQRPEMLLKISLQHKITWWLTPTRAAMNETLRRVTVTLQFNRLTS